MDIPTLTFLLALGFFFVGVGIWCCMPIKEKEQPPKD